MPTIQDRSISECENLIALRFIHLFVFDPVAMKIHQDRQLRDKLDAEKQQDAFQKQKELQILGKAATSMAIHAPHTSANRNARCVSSFQPFGGSTSPFTL